VDTSVLKVAGRRRRRKHSAEFKAQLVGACEQPGMSSAAVAMANGVNANLLRRWVNEAEQRGSTMPVPSPATAASPAPTPEFIPLQLPAPKPQPDIRIELQRSGISVSVTWPVSAAAECASWMREVLR
jgi:transposase-like protein